jgi:ParB/Sulfiredoxin domain
MTVPGARLVNVPLAEIKVGERHRKLPPDEDVSGLSQSILANGLLHPIAVTNDWTLITGARRRLACKAIGWTTIPAWVMPYSALEAELAEIDENLHRRDLSVLEQGEHLLRRDEILRLMQLRAEAGSNQHTLVGSDNLTPPTTTAAIAEQVGLGERTAQRRMELARGLPVEVRDAVRFTPIADCQTDLLTLARLPLDERSQVVDRIREGAKSVAAARRAAQHVDTDDEHDEDATADLEVADHLRTVGCQITLAYLAPNPTMRTRVIAGEERHYPRESVRKEPSAFEQGTLDDAGVEVLIAKVTTRLRTMLQSAQRETAAYAEGARV